VTVSDAHSCSTTAGPFVITQPAEVLSATASVITHVNCNGNANGSVTVTATGGTAPYSYSWSCTPVQTNDTATGLTAGSYTVTVTDDHSCTVTASTTITQPAALVNNFNITHVTMYFGTNGSVTVTPTGGTTPYTYTWSTTPAQTTQTISNLTAGTYWVTTTDSHSCTAASSATVTQPDPITVTSPNGGEVWQRGTTHTITWQIGIPPGNFKIELYKGGVFYSAITNYATGGSFSWYISNTIAAGTDYKIKISSTPSGTFWDYSNSNFTICLGTPGGAITVVSPNGGEAWQRGTSQTITWTDNLSENVKIELFKGGVLHSILTNSTAGTSFNWYIAPTIPAGTDYKIKISSALDPTINDQSNSDFDITLGTPNGTITVTDPNGGEIWQLGTHQSITWTTNVTESIVIDLYKGGVYQTTLSNYGTGGSYDWYIDPTLAAGTDYKILLSSSLDPAINDQSDADFALSSGTPNGTITVTDPNGGEIWQIGSHQTITWTTNVTEYVVIDLYKGGVFQANLSNYGTGGSFDWYVDPTLPAGTNYKVKISSSLDPTITDQSNSNFTLCIGTPNGSITVTSPNGGETWQIGTINTITWTDNLAENVKIELLKADTLYSVVTNSAPSTSFDWYIANTIPAGSNYKIKISSILDPAINDRSNSIFNLCSGTPSGTITVTAPNGGELWQRGTTHSITWTDNLAEDVKIELYKGGVLNATLTNGTGGNSFNWYIANTITPASDYKIRISSILDPSGISDLSDADFSITTGTPSGSITVVSPNGGEA
jgi:hypothetical protein